MRRASVVLCLLLACSAQAEVTLTGPDEPIETREPVDIIVGGIANDDLLRTRVVHWPREGVRVRPILLWGGGNLLPAIEFYARKPGEYKVWVITPTADGLDCAEVVVQVVASEKITLLTDPPKPLPDLMLPDLTLFAPVSDVVQKPLLINELGKAEHQPKAELKTVKPSTRTYAPSKRIFNRFRRR